MTVDGACPIGARARRIAEPKIVITIDPGPTQSTIECTSLAELRDYCSPLAPGALPKTALLFCGVFAFNENLREASSSEVPAEAKAEGGGAARPLSEQLAASGGGVEVQSWSRLPTGSGMGTSSILAAALVACIGRAFGRAYDHDMLVHAVVTVEQMLTTGGGWQDQASARHDAGECTAFRVVHFREWPLRACSSPSPPHLSSLLTRPPPPHTPRPWQAVPGQPWC